MLQYLISFAQLDLLRIINFIIQLNKLRSIKYLVIWFGYYENLGKNWSRGVFRG